MKKTRYPGSNQFARGATKSVITAAGMIGVGIGAHYVKEIVTDASNNSILGYAAGITAVLVGAVVVNSINDGVDRAFGAKSLPTGRPIKPTVQSVMSASQPLSVCVPAPADLERIFDAVEEGDFEETT